MPSHDAPLTRQWIVVGQDGRDAGDPSVAQALPNPLAHAWSRSLAHRAAMAVPLLRPLAGRSTNTAQPPGQQTESASGNTSTGQADDSVLLSVKVTAALARYQRTLARAPLAAASRTEYTARVRGFLAWLETGGRDLDLYGYPSTDPGVRDGAVRDWRSWAKTAPGCSRRRSTTPLPRSTTSTPAAASGRPPLAGSRCRGGRRRRSGRGRCCGCGALRIHLEHRGGAAMR